MQPHAERVVDELKRVVAEAQDLLHQGGNRADEARSAFAARVANARDRVISMERLAARRARDTAARSIVTRTSIPGASSPPASRSRRSSLSR